MTETDVPLETSEAGAAAADVADAATAPESSDACEGAAGSRLLDRLETHARTQPEATAFLFPGDADWAEGLSWADLDDTVRRHAAYIADAGAVPGDTVVVLSASVAQQILGFLGAIAAGCVPTIVSYPSSKQSTESFAAMLRPVLTHSRARLLLYGAPFGAYVDGLEDLTALAPFPAPAELPAPIARIARDPEAPLFLQFSSGTTGSRKAIAISDRMLAEQARIYAQAVDLRADDRIVSWLPLYHDMGLVAAFLVPVYHGVMGVHVSPFDWLMRPEMLFELVAQHRGTLLWLPNFAYELLANRVDPQGLAPVDSLRAIVNCSEPVRQRAHDNFLAAFAGLGVERAMLQTCYAMAETTFAITQSEVGRPATVDRIDRAAFLTKRRAVPADADAPDDSVLTLPACGAPVADTRVRIAGAAGEREVGEIEVQSPSLFAGYLFNAGGAHPFTADGWFQTGDVGYLADGELYVTGRAKDVIIRRGHNVYPTDVEEAVADVPGCKGGRAVAFGVDDEAAGTQDLVLMVERTGDDVDPAALRRDIREALLTALNETAADIVVCEPNTLRKSTAGKLSRGGNHALYLERYAERLRAQREADAAPDAPVSDNPVERDLARIWANALGLRGVAPEARLFAELGADSLVATQVAGEIARSYERELAPSTLLEADTVRSQAALLRAEDGAAAEDGVLVRLQAGAADRAPLFLIHPAAGRAWPYRTLLAHLDADRPVYAFQSPEHFGDASFLDVDGMAERYLTRILELQPRSPYLVAGWSFGGTIAHALARRLGETGRRVHRLVLFDTDPPAPARTRWRFRLRQAAIRAAALSGSAALRHALVPSDLSPCARFLAALRPGTKAPRELARLMRFASPDRLGHVRDDESFESLWAALREVLENDARAAESRPFLIAGQDAATQFRNARLLAKNRRQAVLYRPRRAFPGAIDIVAANDADRLAPWQRFATGPVRTRSYSIAPGDGLAPHFAMFEPENVATFGADVNALLATDIDDGGNSEEVTP